MLANDLARALNPIKFAADCGFESLDSWQADLLTGAAQKALLNCCRQAGKSTITAITALHEAIYAAPALILLVSPSLSQSQELFRKVKEQLNRLEGAPEIFAESALRLELKNGSRVVSLPGSETTVRGFSSARMIVVDEASRVSDELLTAVRPMLATSDGGRFIALTTPAGKRGWFYEAWLNGEDWQKLSVTADQCPRISAEFLEQEQRELGDLAYRQEYFCEFVDDDTQVIGSEIIADMFVDTIEPLWPGIAA